MRRGVAAAAVVVGSLFGVVSGALGEQPRGSEFSDTVTTALVVMFFSGPLLVLAGLGVLVRDRYAGRVVPANARPIVVRTCVAGWLLVLLGIALVPLMVGGIAGSIRLGGDAECRDTDWCGLGTALLAVFAGLAAVTSAAAGAGVLWLARWASRRPERARLLWWLPALVMASAVLWLGGLLVVGGFSE